MKISNKDIVYGVIHDYIKKSKSFTFFDIAKNAKKNGCSLDTFEVRPIVKNAYYPINYKVTPIMVSDRVLEVYHIDSNDPKKYDHRDIINNIKKIPKAKTVARLSREDTSTKSKDELLEDYRNGKIPARLIVPVYKVREAGLRVDDAVKLSFHKDYIEIVKLDSTDKFKFMKRLPIYISKIDAFNNYRIRTIFLIREYGSIEIVDIIASSGKLKIFIKK